MHFVNRIWIALVIFIVGIVMIPIIAVMFIFIIFLVLIGSKRVEICGIKLRGD